ncbi:hypothetical protein VOLCADRAFT_99093 [Volvox carteri f. nagariensis]|uniref:Uncharacterized protein n=1 Tax=Volvox carteri f. nagariensis TaxID=3068 RepID=D8UH06_VOLCA|nr:uncharacterized protein VOLCADRAFT_99091 [Volvox carteri f. nagariensis]XP_002957935.1 uncharacterized protein VOLCADRAFT_99093 [Volvox carteri f. nagariensis]EFJ40959.1 hypothetical protein VOLCADRAFT_99091 [Volvox carteri f. nagariensis]EFJ40961.1 hypothetical protein VOLCADRAFT_99093 [Volvox carteri f. nagariensis]|eukprot:XP_002957933.1 hypothetical protein VOLCADRAFT_99091 [Volvox carteri f. nagariensis]
MDNIYTEYLARARGNSDGPITAGMLLALYRDFRKLGDQMLDLKNEQQLSRVEIIDLQGRVKAGNRPEWHHDGCPQTDQQQSILLLGQHCYHDRQEQDEGSIWASPSGACTCLTSVSSLFTERPDRSMKSWLIDIRWKDRVKYFKAAPDLKRLGLRVDDLLTKEGRAERSRLRPMWQVIKVEQWIPVWCNGAELFNKKRPNGSAPVPYPSQYSDDDSDGGEGGEMDAENDDDAVNMPSKGCAGGVSITGSSGAATGGSMPPPPPPPPPMPMA